MFIISHTHNASGYRGYVSSRAVNGNIIPQRVQNMVMREYSKKNNLRYLLGVVEYYMDDCYMMLESIMEELDQLAGVIFYSIHMLPNDDNYRKLIIQRLLRGNKSLYFALENIHLHEDEDECLINDLFLVKELSIDTHVQIEQIVSYK
jgi:sporadic carbohydrate cluster protein (TIGR04323 family)